MTGQPLRVAFLLTALWCVYGWTGGCRAQSPAEQFTSDVVKPKLEAFLRDKPHVAVAGAIRHPSGSVMFFEGPWDATGNAPPHEQTLFEIGSITKTMTGALLAIAVERGEVVLDAPANNYLVPTLQLPNVQGQPITLAHLATHTSSLPVQPEDIVWFSIMNNTPANPYSKYDVAALSKMLGRLKIRRPPVGTQYAYSNLGVGMLGHALVNAAGANDYEELLKKRLLAPLKMDHTCIKMDPAQEKQLARPHRGSERLPISVWDFMCLEGCGAVRSTPADMLRWMEANMGVIASELEPSLRRAHEVRFSDSGQNTPDEIGVGLGWHHIPTSVGRKFLFHNGGTGGSRSILVIDPSSQCGILLLSNSSHSVDPLGIDLLVQLVQQ